MSTPSLLQGQIALLLQQQRIGQLHESGQGLSLAEALLQPRRKSGREIAAEAITGRIRSDGGMLRQSARNLREGGDIASIAQKGVSSIVESLQKMRDLARKVADGTADSGAAAAYASYASGIKGVVKSTAYNGISLMDRAQWASDDRISISGSGDTGSIDIQSGKTARTIRLADFSGMAVGSTLNTSLDTGSADALATELTVLIKNAQMHENSYRSLASSMNSEAKSVERQSRILDLSASRAIAGAKTDPASRLLYFLLSDQGKLIDNKS